MQKINTVITWGNNKKVLFSDYRLRINRCRNKIIKGLYGSEIKIISFNGAYHGSTFGALSISAISLNMRRKIGSILPDIYHFNYPICIKCPYEKRHHVL